jgi:hypothetical protein
MKFQCADMAFANGDLAVAYHAITGERKAGNGEMR